MKSPRESHSVRDLPAAIVTVLIPRGEAENKWAKDEEGLLGSLKSACRTAAKKGPEQGVAGAVTTCC